MLIFYRTFGKAARVNLLRLYMHGGEDLRVRPCIPGAAVKAGDAKPFQIASVFSSPSDSAVKVSQGVQI